MPLPPQTGSDQSPNVIFTPHGNEHATYRDLHRIRYPGAPFIKYYIPPPDYEGDEASAANGTVHFYIGPGKVFPKSAKRALTALRPLLAAPDKHPAAIEIEFSKDHDWRKGPQGAPEDYRLSAIRWALDQCPVIVLCVDWHPGTEWGEAHYRAAPLQVTVRCQHAQAPAWEAFLQERLKPQHRLFIVHGAAGSA